MRCSPDFDVVGQQPAVDGFGCVGHEGASFEAGLLQEPGQSAAVVQVETVKIYITIRAGDRHGGKDLYLHSRLKAFTVMCAELQFRSEAPPTEQH